MFVLRAVETWTFVAFSLTLMQPILLFCLSALVMPDFDRDEGLDLKAIYFAQVRWFFGMIVALVVVSMLRTYSIEGRLPNAPDLAFHIAFIVGALPAALIKHERFHQVAALVAAAAIFAYVAALLTVLR